MSDESLSERVKLAQQRQREALASLSHAAPESVSVVGIGHDVVDERPAPGPEWPAVGVDEHPVDSNAVDMRQVLPVAELDSLSSEIVGLLRSADKLGMSEFNRAALVATWIAPRLADLQLQVGQSGAALSALVDEFNRLDEVARRRAHVGHRLRKELAAALVEAGRFRTLTEQRCPVGLHDGWFAPSGGKQHPCPWCLLAERTEDVERLREHIAECHRLQNNIAAVLGVETDWDEAGRKTVLDAVCRMSGNLADACRAESGSGGGTS